ncbi:S100P-binding protein isoform X2 [Mixophyes fleayi]|uniref:S100P-binding protein isoform X2 n=1 Tax=Mixophyes fleayi TaxID=3061075 RepID=UPI003F4E0CCE
MRAINENCDQSKHRACSERQVLLLPSDYKDLLPGTMEEIKISIVNERATGSKRKRDEVTAVTPDSKKLRSAVFRCSTPRSTSFQSWNSASTTQADGAKQGHVDIPCHSLEQNTELCDEWDDSLLEPSDNEDDSPLYLTLDEIESLLEDDSSSSAEPSGWDDKNNTCMVKRVPLESKSDGEKVSASPYKELELSNTLPEESECDEDQNNYAAMAPSPCHSVIYDVQSVELTKQKSYSMCGVSAPPGSFQYSTIVGGVSGLIMPLSDLKEAPAVQFHGACSPKPLQLSTSLSEKDVVEEFSEDSELDFDCDINDLLATSPREDFLSEEERGSELAAPSTKDISKITHSTSPLQPLNSVQVPAACFSTHGLVQEHSVSSHNKPDSLRIHPLTKPETLKEICSSTSSVVIPEPHPSTGESAVGRDTRPSNAGMEDTTERPEVGSTTSPTELPISLSATLISSNQLQISASVGCRKPDSPASAKEKSQAAVTPLPRPASRQFISHFELEANKNNYCDQVLIHIRESEGVNNWEGIILGRERSHLNVTT